MRQPSLVHPRKFTTKFGAIVGVFVLVGGLFVWNVAEHATPSAAAAAPACTTSNLDVWLNTMGNGAAGSSYYNLNFTNLSAHSCTLYGYPGISAITQTGIQLGSSAGRNAEHAPAHITLTSARTARGFETSTAHNTATAIVQIAVAENFPNATCSWITASGLRVYPPGQKESTVVPYPFVACGKSGPVFLHVEAIQRFVAAAA
jgi:hypothetical protein